MKKNMIVFLTITTLSQMATTANATTINENIITKNESMTVENEIINHIVNLSNDGNGSITYDNKDGDILVPEGETIVLQIKANAGYELDKLFLNGDDVTKDIKDNKFTFSKVSQDAKVRVTFKKIKQEIINHIVNLSNDGNGSITYDNKDGDILIPEGETIVLQIKANAGYELDKLFLNGDDVTKEVKDNKFTFSKVSQDAKVRVTFKKIKQEIINHIVNLSNDGNGSITYDNKDGDILVPEGETIVLQIKANAGYELDKLFLNGDDVTKDIKDNKFTFSKVSQDAKVRVTFKKIKQEIINHIVNLSNDGNGSITYDNKDGDILIPEGETIVLQIKANAGYELDKLFLNGDDVTKEVKDNKFTFSKVSQDAKVRVTFKKIKQEIINHIVNLSNDGNGSITYDNKDGDILVPEGETIVLQIKANAGYELDKLFLNGDDVTKDIKDNKFTFSKVSQDAKVRVTFKKIKQEIINHIVNLSNDGNGSITYDNKDGDILIPEGETIVLQIKANAGYELDKLFLNGDDVTKEVKDNKFTFSKVSQDAKVRVTFKKIKQEIINHIVNLSNDGNGSITYDNKDGDILVPEGETIVLQIKANAGYELDKLFLNGDDVTKEVKDNKFTFSKVSQDAKVRVTFKKIKQEIINHIVNLSNDGNGSITYDNKDGDILVPEGETIVLQIKANAGYELDKLFLNGDDVTKDIKDNKFTFSKVSQDAKVRVTFKKIKQEIINHIVNLSNDGNGSITYDNKDGDILVPEGETIVLQIKANAGYELDKLFLNGDDVTKDVKDNKFTFSKVSQDAKVRVTFKKIKTEVEPEKPGTPDVKPGTPDVKPGTPDVKPGTPDVKPGTPDVKPGTKPNIPQTGTKSNIPLLSFLLLGLVSLKSKLKLK